MSKARFVHWLVVLYRPILLSLVIGLLISSLVAQGKTQRAADNAAAAANESKNATNQLKAFTEAVGGAVNNINDNTNRIGIQIACLLAVHGQGQIIDENVRAECEQLANEPIRTQLISPAPSNSSQGTSQNSTSQPQNTNPGQGANNPPGNNPGNENPPPPPPEESLLGELLPGHQPPVVGCQLVLGQRVCI